jgi:SAM-dependent methyltransferase
MPDKPCALCGGPGLVEVYRPPTSRCGQAVYVCRDCSFVQSFPRDRAALGKGRLVPRLTAGADFGNLRYHQSIMHERVLGFIEDSVEMWPFMRILDIGANRGHLVLALCQETMIPVVAVEPDSRVSGWGYSEYDVELHEHRFEDVDLSERQFDLITCIHTLEHVAEPVPFLAKAAGLLAPGGRIVVEVPDIRVIEDAAIVEEFFNDKHLSHFSGPTLDACLALAGLQSLVYSRQDSCLTVAAKAAWASTLPEFQAARTREIVPAAEQIAAIDGYVARLGANRERLRDIGWHIATNAECGVLLCGAGRIFAAFAEVAGEMVRGKVLGLVDTYLPLDEAWGFPVLRWADADALPEPGLVVVFSRDSYDDIAAEVARRWPEAEVMRYDEAMEGGQE